MLPIEAISSQLAGYINVLFFVLFFVRMGGGCLHICNTLISSPGNNQGYVMIALTMPVHPSLHPTVILLHRYFIEQES